MAEQTTAVTVVAPVVGDVGGQERATATLVRELLCQGARVTLITSRSLLAQHNNLRVIRLPIPKRPAALAFPMFYILASVATACARRGLVHAAGAIVANRVDVVTVHFVHSHYHKKIRIPRRRRPNVAYFLNESIHALLAQWAEHWTFSRQRASVVVAVSMRTCSELHANFPKISDRTVVIVNGVDLNIFQPNKNARLEVRQDLGLTEDQLVAIFLGGDWERKGLRFAIDALRFAQEWSLLVVGEGERGQFRKCAVEAGVGDRVIFVGHRVDPQRFMASADAFVLPTAYEAFPLACLEAAGCGLPLLVTQINGVEQLIHPGRNGWFVTRSGADIGKRLDDLKSNRSLRFDMARASRETATRFSWSKVVESYQSLYQELLGRN